MVGSPDPEEKNIMPEHKFNPEESKRGEEEGVE